MERYRAQVRPTNIDAQIKAQGESVVDFFHRFMDYKAKEVDTRTLEKYGALGTRLMQFFQRPAGRFHRRRKGQGICGVFCTTKALVQQYSEQREIKNFSTCLEKFPDYCF